MSKKKSVLLWVIPLIILVLVGGYFLIQMSGLGFSTLSLSKVDLSSSNPFFSGEAWVLTVRQEGMAQQAYGKFSPDKVGDEWVGVEKPKEDFLIDIFYQNQECVYEINPDYSEIPVWGDIKRVEWNAPVWVVDNPLTPDKDEILDYCKENSFSKCGDMVVVGSVYRVNANCNVHCAVKENGASGDFGSPSVNQKYDIGVKRGDESSFRYKSFSTGGELKSKGFVTDNVYAVWQGNLVSGKPCVDKDEYKPLYVNGGWRITRSDAYRRYELAYSGWRSVDSDDLSDIWMRDVNSKADEALKKTSFLGQSSRFSKQSDLSNALVIAELDSPIQYALITLYVKSSWLGVYTPIGQPEILGVGSEVFLSGSDGKIEVKFKNSGDERDDFEVFAECSSPFMSYDRKTFSMKPGEIITTSLVLSGSTNLAEKKGVCVVHVNGNVAEDTEEVSVSVKSYVVCGVGDLVCKNGNVYVCKEDKTGYEVFKVCSGGCVLDDTGKPFCAESPCKKVGGSCDSTVDCCGGLLCEGFVCVEKGECEPVLSLGSWVVIPSFGSRSANVLERVLGKVRVSCMSVFEMISLGVAILALFFVPILASGFLRKNDLMPKDKGGGVIVNIFFVILGLFVYLLVLNLFWVGVIILVVFLLLRILVFKK